MSDNPIFSYTKRDYEAARQEGISKIPELSGGQWSDLNATDPGIIILDYVHALVDMINYYQDHQALETFMTTAKERANIFRIAKQLSYEIRSAKGAKCNVTFVSSLLYDHIIKIPKHTLLRTPEGIPWLTSEDAFLPKGEGEVTVNCYQGEYFEEKYVGTGISRHSNVERPENQSYHLSSVTIDMDSISIVDNLGVTWNRVDYMAFADKNEKAYQLELNPDNSISIMFGDGNRGYIPTKTDELTIGYVYTEAEKGRASANSIIELETPILDEGVYVDFTVYNKEASNGGYSAQSSREIRETAPGAIKAQNRAVTLSDFENLAKLVEGVLDAKAYDINIKPDLCLYHEVKVLVTPEESYNSPETLSQTVYDYLSQRMIPPTNLQVLIPSDVYIDISIEVKKLDNKSEKSLEYEIQETVKNYFSSRYGMIGEDFYPADLAAHISRIDNVRYIASITPASPVAIDDFSTAKLGNLSIKLI